MGDDMNMKGRWPLWRRRMSMADIAIVIPLIFSSRRVFVFSLVVIPYVLFQRKVLPPTVARCVGRIYFYPSLPLTRVAAWYRGNRLWNNVDNTLLIGVSPV